MRQLAKTTRSSKSTAGHIKKMSSDSLSLQVNLLRDQRTELPPTKAQRKQLKKTTLDPKQDIQIMNKHQAHYMNNDYKNKKQFNQDRFFKGRQSHKCGDSKHIERFQCSARKYM